MADILIRGMEMPKDCPHCEFAAIGYASPMSSGYTLYCRAVDKFAATQIQEKGGGHSCRYGDCPYMRKPEECNEERIGWLDWLKQEVR